MTQNDDQINTLRALAREVEAYRLERGLSLKKLEEKIADIGSSKTLKRILDESDPLEKMDIEGQLKNYRSAVAYIKELRTRERAAEPIYEDFANILESRSAVARAMTEESIARLVIISGATSTGKDAVKDTLIKLWPNKTIEVEADEFWRDSLGAPTAALYHAVGIINRGGGVKMPNYPMDRAQDIIDELRKRKVVLMINEAHHMGIRALNFCKTIINKTPTVMVWLCEPTLMTKLLASSFTETTQLTGNRLFEVVKLKTPRAAEILTLMDRRGVKFADLVTRNGVGARLQAEASYFGNWRFVIQVARLLADASKKSAVDLKAANVAIETVSEMRTRLMRQQEN